MTNPKIKNQRTSRRRSNSRKRRTSRKKKNTNLKMAMSGLTGLAIGAGLKSLYKKSTPKQGFVFTPAYEETGQVCLLIIDPQNDFMDKGSLEVPGAKDDMNRLSTFIKNNETKIDSVCVTLDTHSLFHIGNGFAYQEEPSGITVYEPDKYHAKQNDKVKGLDQHIRSYAEKLGKPHVLWPLHCQLGTAGHAVYDTLYNALKEWSNKSHTEVRYVIKGCDTKYENFSVFRSAGVDKHNYSNPNKEAYKFNLDLAKHLYQFPILYIAGEARTHCVFDSTSDYVDWVKSKGNPKKQRIYVLWNCMSDIPGYEMFKNDFKELINSTPFMHLVEDEKTRKI
jgi:nicotinamidase/pyrazinamidase